MLEPYLYGYRYTPKRFAGVRHDEESICFGNRTGTFLFSQASGLNNFHCFYNAQIDCFVFISRRKNFADSYMRDLLDGIFDLFEYLDRKSIEIGSTFGKDGYIKHEDIINRDFSKIK